MRNRKIFHLLLLLVLSVVWLSGCSAPASIPTSTATQIPPTPTQAASPTSLPQSTPTQTIEPETPGSLVKRAFQAQKERSWVMHSQAQSLDGQPLRSIVVEYVPPDRYRITSETNPENQSILIGRKAYGKVNGAWRLLPEESTTIALGLYTYNLDRKSIDPVQDLEADTLDERPVHKYQFEEHNNLTKNQATLWVGAEDNLPYKIILKGRIVGIDPVTMGTQLTDGVTTIVYAYDQDVKIDAPVP